MNNANNNTNLELTYALCHYFVYYVKHSFIVDKETYIWNTNKDFDSTDFIGCMKDRSEMPPYRMLLDLV